VVVWRPLYAIIGVYCIASCTLAGRGEGFAPRSDLRRRRSPDHGRCRLSAAQGL